MTRDDGGGDVFVHQSDIHSEGFRSLRDQEPVEFELEEIGEDGRYKAVKVRFFFPVRALEFFFVFGEIILFNSCEQQKKGENYENDLVSFSSRAVFLARRSFVGGRSGDAQTLTFTTTAFTRIRNFQRHSAHCRVSRRDRDRGENF